MAKKDKSIKEKWENYFEKEPIKNDEPVVEEKEEVIEETPEPEVEEIIPESVVEETPEPEVEEIIPESVVEEKIIEVVKPIGQADSRMMRRMGK